jgi:hypothetical protein
MVQPPSSVSFITCGSKSSGTPVGFGDLTGCLRSFFTYAPSMRQYPLSQYRSRDGLRIVVIKLLGLRITSSRPKEPRPLRALILPVRSRERMGRKVDELLVIKQNPLAVRYRV